MRSLGYLPVLTLARWSSNSEPQGRQLISSKRAYAPKANLCSGEF
jgi:hypothetical protein